MEQNGIPKKFPRDSHSDRPWGSPKENPAALAVAPVAPVAPEPEPSRRAAAPAVPPTKAPPLAAAAAKGQALKPGIGWLTVSQEGAA